ncbi:hypothetical protein CAPTEDRAFT_194531 [Capitella teleta]|uniref:Secreted protein n=1 Tax=Capitella teleta TaxID=283909 RepID=R7TGU9_CAPTE|nr:hypothetical protein CAPTEDRAFT_194531 [Capitella teleta]|eukprot:ELT93038.1 hypothetical protein CAPTEDRAFT_194531 [Capitella teleta]
MLLLLLLLLLLQLTLLPMQLMFHPSLPHLLHVQPPHFDPIDRLSMRLVCHITQRRSAAMPHRLVLGRMVTWQGMHPPQSTINLGITVLQGERQRLVYTKNRNLNAILRNLISDKLSLYDISVILGHRVQSCGNGNSTVMNDVRNATYLMSQLTEYSCGLLVHLYIVIRPTPFLKRISHSII